MKNLLIILSAAVLMASCSGSGFLKRKYTKGNYRESVSNTSTPKSLDIVKNTTPKTADVLIKPSVTETSTYTKAKVNEGAVYFAETKKTTPTAFKNHFTATPVSVTFKPKNIETAIKESKKTITKKTQSGGDMGGNMILWVILCFFPLLCLIPVYRHDGRKATLNFWLTLLLHLTVVGYIIYSLLVILDVVDLS